MNIKYPMLVEQSYKFLKEAGFELTKAEVYRKMIEANIIDRYGKPTDEAIKEGWVKNYDADNPIQKFKQVYGFPFNALDDKHYRLDEQGNVLIDAPGLAIAAAAIQLNPSSGPKAVRVAECIENELRKKGYLGGDDK